MFIVQTQPGLGGMAWEEIRDDLARPNLVAQRHASRKDDLVLFNTTSPLTDLLDLHLAEDVFVTAVRAFNIASTESGLRQIHAAVRNSPIVEQALRTWSAATKMPFKALTFRVVARSTGKQDYSRKAFGRAVGDGVRDGWPGHWRAVEDDAQIELWTTLFGSELIVALRMSTAAMRHRIGRMVDRPAALRPAVAAAMVRLTRPAATDVFLDPMAGTGTIIAERALIGPYQQLIAGDKSRTAVQSMTKNLPQLGGDLAIRRLDVTDLPFQDGEISKIASNLPFGRQVSNIDELRQLYRGAFREMARVVCAGGIIVVLAAEPELVQEFVATNPTLMVRSTYPIAVLGQPATILQIERR